MYYIASLKRTKKEDKFLLLWRPDDAGYTFGIQSAGRYENPVKGYHDSENNLPIKIEDSAVMLEYALNDENEIGILNNPANRKILRIAYFLGKLKKTPPNRF